MKLLIFFSLILSPNVSAILSPGGFDQSKNPDSVCAVIFENKNGGREGVCTGDIVGRDKILTAGHCVSPLKADESIFVRCQDQRERIVKGYSVYPLFRVQSGNPKPEPYDHALLQTESEFDLTNLGKVSLPKNGMEAMVLAEKGNCAIFGYGVNSKGKILSLLGGPVKPVFKDFSGFPMLVFTGPSMIGDGDSGGGLFCLPHGKTYSDNWTRIATLSQIGVLPGGGLDFGVSALLSDPVLEWIERFIDRDLPLVPDYSPSVALQTIDPEDMETSEECIARLVGTIARACLDDDTVIDDLVDEVIYQCGRNESPELLQSLLEQGRTIVGCSSRPAAEDQTVISRADGEIGDEGGGISRDGDERDSFRAEESPLSKASRECDFDTAFALIEKGADVNARSLWGGTPLHWAARGECLDIVRLLIDSGADVNIQDIDGDTFLYKLVSFDYNTTESIAALLIDSGADVEIRNKRGETAFDTAETRKVKKLLAKHANSFFTKMHRSFIAVFWPL